MGDVYLPSDRSPSTQYRGSGIKITRPLTGETKKSNKFAYKNPIRTQKDLLYLSKGTLLSSSAPFTLPIRNAGMNLNADMSQLKFTPRSGALPRITDWEMGELIPEKNPQGATEPPPTDGEKQPEDLPEELPETGGEGDLNNADVPFNGKLVSENKQLSDAEYLSAVIAEEGYRPLADRGKNGRIVDAGYQFVPQSSNEQTSVFTDGNNVIVTLTGRPLLDQNAGRTAKDKLKIKEIAQHFKQEGKKGRIIVTGHAAGGALAGSAVRELLKEDPSLSQNLYGVTFNQLAGLGACQGPECDNVVNLRVKGDIGSSMDTNYTREIDATCGERSVGDMTQFTGQRCKHDTIGGKIMGSLNWFGESLVGNTWELAQAATKAGAGLAVTAAGGAAGGLLGGPVGGAAGAVAAQAVYQKAAGAVLGSEELKRRTLESASKMRQSSKVKERQKTLLEGTVEVAGEIGGLVLGTAAGVKAVRVYKNRGVTAAMPPPLPRRPGGGPGTSRAQRRLNNRRRLNRSLGIGGASSSGSTQTMNRTTIDQSTGMPPLFTQDIGVGTQGRRTSTGSTQTMNRTMLDQSTGMPPSFTQDIGVGTQGPRTSTGSTQTPKFRKDKGVNTNGPQTRSKSTGMPPSQATTSSQTSPYVTGGFEGNTSRRSVGVTRGTSTGVSSATQSLFGRSRTIDVASVMGSSPSYITPRSEPAASNAPPTASNSLVPATSMDRQIRRIAEERSMRGPLTAEEFLAELDKRPRIRQRVDERTIREGQAFTGPGPLPSRRRIINQYGNVDASEPNQGLRAVPVAPRRRMNADEQALFEGRAYLHQFVPGTPRTSSLHRAENLFQRPRRIRPPLPSIQEEPINEGSQNSKPKKKKK